MSSVDTVTTQHAVLCAADAFTDMGVRFSNWGGWDGWDVGSSTERVRVVWNETAVLVILMRGRGQLVVAQTTLTGAAARSSAMIINTVRSILEL